jgi:polysaccharide biosynthesis/export protein
VETQAPVAPAAPPGTSTPDTGSGSGPDNTLRFGTGDLLEMSVYNVPELATKARVSTSGDVYLPLIDYVHVSGLTTEEAQALIEKRYADGGFLKEPHIALFVDEYASQGASVLGEVTKPAVYPVIGQERLFDLISAAGGFTEKAGRTVTVTHRNQPDKPVTLALARNVSDTPESNIDVFPGDTVLVRKADVVYVVGDVARPSGFLMDVETLTVLKAIALAGGYNKTAKLNSATIIRKGPNGMTETPVQLKKILQAKVQDIPMKADDILYVPSSGGKVFAARSFDAAMQAATAVSIIAVHP